MAHFLKGDTDNKKVDEILKKADDVDLSQYQKKLTAGEGISIDEDNVIKSTASGGTQLYLHSITSTQSTSFQFYFITDQPSYDELSSPATANDFVKLFRANIRKDANAVNMKYTSFYNSYRIAAIYPEGTMILSQRCITSTAHYYTNGEFYATFLTYDVNFESTSTLNSIHIQVTSLVDTVTPL